MRAKRKCLLLSRKFSYTSLSGFDQVLGQSLYKKNNFVDGSTVLSRPIEFGNTALKCLSQLPSPDEPAFAKEVHLGQKISIRLKVQVGPSFRVPQR